MKHREPRHPLPSMIIKNYSPEVRSLAANSAMSSDAAAAIVARLVEACATGRPVSGGPATAVRRVGSFRRRAGLVS